MPKRDANWHYSLNALHPLSDVLQAYLQTRQDRYLSVARSVMLDWIDTRVLVLRMGEWLCVIDRVEASRSRRYRQWFGFHEDAGALLEPGSKALRVTLPRGGPTVFVNSVGPSGAIEPEIVKGRTGKNMRGWLSREYRKKVPRYSVGFGQRGEALDLVTLLSVDATVDELSVKPGEGRLEVSFLRNGAREGFEYHVDGERGQVIR